VSELLTVAEASRRLGLDPRGERLQRLIVAAEKRVRRRIALRVEGKSYTRWKVTEASLRRYLPELFDGVGLDRLETLVRGHLRDIDQRIDERAEGVCLRVIAPIRRELEDRDERVASMVVEVSKRVAELASAIAERENDDQAGIPPDSDS
jgi:hypothetical protein